MSKLYRYSTCPQMALTASQVVAASSVAASAVQGLSLHAAVSAVTVALEETARQAARRDAAEQSVAVAALVGVSPTLYGAEQQLRSAWETAEDPGPLELYVSALVAEGIDAERLVWAIINVEASRHVRLVHHESNKLAGHFANGSTDDMLTYGWLGLRLALRRFDPALGLQFSTYACKRISGSIRDGLRKESHLAKRLITQVREISRNEEDLAAELGRLPTREEVAMSVGMTVAELAATNRFSAPVSLDELRASDNGVELPPLMLPGDTTSLPAEDNVLSEAVTLALGELSDETASVARSVLCDGVSIAEVSRETGIPARRVRQYCDAAQSHLADRLAAWA